MMELTLNDLKNIKHPTLILSGAKDKMMIPGILDSMHESLPNSRLEYIEGAGHAFNIEAPDETNELIWRFILENR